MDDIWGGLLAILFPAVVVFPLGDLVQFIEEKNSSALTTTDLVHGEFEVGQILLAWRSRPDWAAF